MVVIFLAVIGLCLGSFVNAWVWRLHELETVKSKATRKQLSIVHGRSMCPSCKHELAAKDLVPLFSWIFLAGQCRYCKKPISAQYPIVELITALLFVGSYLAWPFIVADWEIVALAVWLICLPGLMALTVYDLRWYILPDKVVFGLAVLAALIPLTRFIEYRDVHILFDAFWGVIAVSGLFYGLFQLSAGKWIGGGDVKLGVALGLFAGSFFQGLLIVFVASLLGSLVALPMMIRHQATVMTQLPFGPFLIAATMIIVLYGQRLADGYLRLLGM